MVNIVKFTRTTRSKIDLLEYGGESRPYLGMSGLGHHCMRYLWLKFHWVYERKHDGRKERIFNVGHLFEPQIIKQLKEAGLEIYKVIDGKEVEHFGQQNEEQEEYIGFAGHVKGHGDGRARGVIECPEIDHLLEIKTMKEAKFIELAKKGLRITNNVYYSQTQRYMKSAKLGWCLFIAMNKNTCQIYIERVRFNEKFANELIRKERTIILSDTAPIREYAKDFFKCNYCDLKGVCYGDIRPDMNCRSCDYADMENGGVWTCSIKNKKLSVEEQRQGCKHWIKGWNLNEI